jgi:hypothetical protein
MSDQDFISFGRRSEKGKKSGTSDERGTGKLSSDEYDKRKKNQKISKASASAISFRSPPASSSSQIEM